MAPETDGPAYVDRLSFGSCLAARRWRWDGGCRTRRVVVLDPLPGGLRGLALGAWARVLRLRVESVEFFAGHLRDDRGESVYRVARRESAFIAFRLAGDIVRRAPRLAALDARYGRQTLRLFLAKRIWPEIELPLRKLFVACALARREHQPARVVLGVSRKIDERWLYDRAWGAQVVCHGWRTPMVGWGSALHGFAKLATAITKERLARGARGPVAARPSVLSLQEDDLGLDRAVRAQPHWLPPDQSRPSFQTYIWLNHDTLRAPFDRAALEAAGVTPLSESDAAAILSRMADGPLERRLARDAATCFLAAWTTSRAPQAAALASVGKLLLRARLAAAICRGLGVKAFLSGESYLADADAVQLVAPELGVQTVSYQYSNISFVSPSMMNTADLMLLFSPMYRRNWIHDGISPRAFAVLGYPWDASFAALRARAARTREAMARAGATFVIGYMDENAQNDRYAQVSTEEHEADIFALCRAVVADSTLGVIVKTQFMRNVPSHLFGGRPELEAAKATGRYVELGHGQHRNTALPAEAALASDLTIGHAIGGTAVLEAALAGCRSLMLNPYAWRGTWDDLYHRADIVYPSLASALEAVTEFRSGYPARLALGDWSAILPEFDPYRDGLAAARLRTLLNRIVAGVPAAAAASECLGPPVAAVHARAGRGST